MNPLLSVIVPVYNGEQHLPGLLKDLARQTLKDREILLVLNGCTDGSERVAREAAERYADVRVILNEEKGLLLARKRGIAEARGRCIVFADVDDGYNSPAALEKMCAAIEADGADICQFGHVHRWGPVKKTVCPMDGNEAFSREELLAGKLKSVFIGAEKSFDGYAWSKIYAAAVLKNIRDRLIDVNMQEDVLLNFLAFSDPSVKRVSCRREAYYVYRAGVGMSAQGDSAMRLLADYRRLKPAMEARIRELGLDDSLLAAVWSEAVYCCRAVIRKRIEEKEDRPAVLAGIREIQSYEYITRAKDFFRTHREYSHEELDFLCGDFTPEEYYDYCAAGLPKRNPKAWLKRRAKRLLGIFNR